MERLADRRSEEHGLQRRSLSQGVGIVDVGLSQVMVSSCGSLTRRKGPRERRWVSGKQSVGRLLMRFESRSADRQDDCRPYNKDPSV